MFRTVPLSIIRSLFTVHSAMVYVIQVCKQLSSRTRMEPVPSCSLSKAVYRTGPGWNQFHPVPSRKLPYKPVWHIPLLSVQWINSWWWTEELSETCRVSCQNKFVKVVYLVGFIINVEDLVSTATWRPGFVHPCSGVFDLEIHIFITRAAKAMVYWHHIVWCFQELLSV